MHPFMDKPMESLSCCQSQAGFWESASVDMTVVADFQTVVLPKIIEDYEPRDIFNADETGLFWRAQPTKTHEFKGKVAMEENSVKTE